MKEIIINKEYINNNNDNNDKKSIIVLLFYYSSILLVISLCTILHLYFTFGYLLVFVQI